MINFECMTSTKWLPSCERQGLTSKARTLIPRSGASLICMTQREIPLNYGKRHKWCSKCPARAGVARNGGLAISNAGRCEPTNEILSRRPRISHQLVQSREIMPELPEVETIANGLNKRIAGDRIDSVWVGNKPEPLKSSAAEISAALEGAKVERVRRVGKHIVFDLGSGNTPDRQWIVHLGMTGKMLVATPETEVAKHTHLVAKLASGRELRFADPRRFGRLEVRQTSFSGPGAEPLNIGMEEFARLFHSSKAPVKAACSTKSCCTGWGTSMRMKLCSALMSGHGAGRIRLQNLGCAGACCLAKSLACRHRCGRIIDF